MSKSIHLVVVNKCSIVADPYADDILFKKSFYADTTIRRVIYSVAQQTSDNKCQDIFISKNRKCFIGIVYNNIFFVGSLRQQCFLQFTDQPMNRCCPDA